MRSKARGRRKTGKRHKRPSELRLATRTASANPALLAEAMPTKERMHHAGYHFEMGSSRGRRVVRMTDAPMDRLLAGQQLTVRQYEALQRLRQHWYLGSLAGNVRGMDLDKVAGSRADDYGGGDSQLMHKQAFAAACRALTVMQRAIVQIVVLTEGGLTSAGAEMGYASAYRGRMAALEVLQHAGDRLARLWRHGA